ncbi:MAG: prepilin-type N-terminal cleavage/methylation domain-containing protein [Opitutaceae bacterium]
MQFNAKASHRSGFTLVEILVGATLSAFIMVGVFSAYLMLGRMGANIRNYADMEAQGRKALETFGREVRMAYDINQTLSASSVTLFIPDSSRTRNGTDTSLGHYQVTYAFDSVNRLFTRQVTIPNVAPINATAVVGPVETLVSNVQQVGAADFFKYYRRINTSSSYAASVAFDSNITAIYGETQQIEVCFLVDRNTTTVPTARNKVLSAHYILRNK